MKNNKIKNPTGLCWGGQKQESKKMHGNYGLVSKSKRKLTTLTR
jgi:hypothetical protein